jgi:hypothetical protein
MGFGFFVLPVAGPIVALGPIAGMIAGAIGGAGIGALVNTLVSMGMSRDQALKYEARLQAGEFLLTVVGTPEEIESARNLLQGTGEVDLQTFENSQTAA